MLDVKKISDALPRGAVKEIASATGLCTSTVRNILKGRVKVSVSNVKVIDEATRIIAERKELEDRVSDM